MRIFLFVAAGIAFAVGFAVLSTAKNAINEIEGFLLFLIGAVFFIGAAIVGAIRSTRK